MPTVVGPWYGGSSPARIEIDYSVSYSSDRTNAYFSATVYIATQYSISDSVNSWAVSGHLGAVNGSNLSVNHGSNGGRTAIRSLAAWYQGNPTVNALISGLNAIGVTVEASLVLEAGALAPYVTSYQTANLGANSFVAQINAASGNGGSLNNAQVMLNTTQLEAGASFYTAGSFKNVDVTGLTRATRYYYVVRVHNTTWGWGPWTSWTTVDTLTTAPGTPVDAWDLRDVTQVDAFTTGLAVSDNGGLDITDWQVQWNTTESATGASSANSGSGTADAKLVNLLPGTTYYARVRAYNTKGWGAYSGWKSFTTLPGVYVNVGGVWRNAIPYVKHNGVWQQATRYIKDAGLWK